MTPVPRVVFVCTANSARSQLAAALWSGASAVPATSAGTHPAAADRARAPARTARKHGLRLAQDDSPNSSPTCSTRPTSWSRCATTPTRSSAPSASRPPVALVGPDPVRVGTDDAFDAAYDDLATRVAHLAPRLTELHRLLRRPP